MFPNSTNQGLAKVIRDTSCKSCYSSFLVLNAHENASSKAKQDKSTSRTFVAHLAALQP